ncbi:MAG: R3H domain-containing nucleic acid-binding protein [Chloroflexota bacterium]|nr:R3H domain-containing nucleic acid-binding protein [Chloroflexota bacterium]
MSASVHPEARVVPEGTDDLEALLDALPPEIGERMRALEQLSSVIEIVMDLGRQPEARFGGGGEEILARREVGPEDIQYVVDHVGSFGEDNRAGIERTLHRISAIRNRNGKIVGLTCRVGRAVFGTIQIIDDLVESNQSILIMGRPGIGKTTMLREAARVLADDLDKRVVIVDTSNEIAGDGDIPHPGIGRARRMQVKTPDLQHAVMIEAVENHMPEVIVIDEIGTELEAVAARTIAERGVQLIGTAHGNNLDNLLMNPTLSDLIGGIQTVTLGDDEARRRRTQKSVLERKAPPTFDVIVEIQDRDRVALHADVAETVDAMLRGDALAPEMRWRDEGGVHRSQSRQRPGPRSRIPGERFGGVANGSPGPGGFGSEATLRGDRRGPGSGTSGRAGAVPRGRSRGRRGSDVWPGEETRHRAGGAAVFRAGAIADRGPLERGTVAPEPRARDAREIDRQAEWRASANRAMSELAADQVEAEQSAADAAVDGGRTPVALGIEAAPSGRSASVDEEESLIRLSEISGDSMQLEPMNVLGFGISRKRLEQAIKDLQLPVVVVREPDEADVVITLRSSYKQKSPLIREVEARGIPIYVLKSNTVVQMQAILTSLYVLDSDPGDIAMRELEEAIGLVRSQSKPVELSPQNAYLRKLQHRAAEAANLVSRSRGREPFRRVRVYPEKVRSWR